MLALLMLRGGGRSLFSTRLRCRPFTQPSASTRIVLSRCLFGGRCIDAVETLAFSPSKERMACGIDVSGPASSGWVNESPCSFSSADPLSRVGMKQTFRRRGAFWGIVNV